VFIGRSRGKREAKAYVQVEIDYSYWRIQLVDL